MINLELPYLPAGRGKTDLEMMLWIEGHYERVSQYFDAMAPEQFLRVALEDEPSDQITSFLECNGNFTMPHRNENRKRTKLSD